MTRGSVAAPDLEPSELKLERCCGKKHLASHRSSIAFDEKEKNILNRRESSSDFGPEQGMAYLMSRVL
jgi:hypothetical protein